MFSFLSETGDKSFRRLIGLFFSLILGAVVILAIVFKIDVDFKVLCVIVGAPLVVILYVISAITITDVKQILSEIKNNGKIDSSIS